MTASSQISDAVAAVSRMVADGHTLADACAHAAAEHGIEDRRKLTGAEFVQRRWLAAQPDRGPSPLRARGMRRHAVGTGRA